MPGGRPRHPEVLTPAEQRVLEALRDGRTNADIAIELGLSVNTVKYHVANMLAKLDLHTRDELSGWKPRPGRGLWAVSTVRIAVAVGISVAGGAALAGAALFAINRGGSGSGVDGPPIVYVSPFSNTGSNLFSVQPGRAPKQLTHQGNNFVFSPVWSPDGTTLVYLDVPGAHERQNAAAAGTATLTLLDKVTGEVRDLDDNASVQSPSAQVASPFWTDDGTLIAFQTQDFVASSIKPDGTGRQDHELGCLAPAWSSDGMLAACVVRGTDGDAMWLVQGPQDVPPTGSGARRQVSSGIATSGAGFSHDGRWLSWSEVSRDGQEHLLVLALDPVDPLAGDLRPTDIGPGYDPRWSPTGDKLAFSSAPSIELLGMMGLPIILGKQTGDVFLYDTSDEHRSNLTTGMGANFDAAWSPDGKQLAFVSTRDGGDGIWVMNADGSHLQRITNDGAPKLMLSWAPG